jgi:hypothetical protein
MRLDYFLIIISSTINILPKIMRPSFAPSSTAPYNHTLGSRENMRAAAKI